MKYIKVLGLSLIVLLGLKLTSNAVVTGVVGTTTRQASQLIFWYDQAFTGFGRFTQIQVTNDSSDSVNVHVQIFTNTAGVSCKEFDFEDAFTGNDTHIYDLADVVRNNPANPTAVGINLIDTKGFIVVTPVNNPTDNKAISFQHLFGNSYVFDKNGFTLHRLNSMGRDAVGFADGSIVPDGTVLDGVANGYVLLQPERLKFNFASVSALVGGTTDFADIIGIAFQDTYGTDGYSAQPSTASWSGLIFDENENPVSSCQAQGCFFDIGLNDAIIPANTLLGKKEFCPGNTTPRGWVDISVGLPQLPPATGGELATGVGLTAFTVSPFGAGDATWMHAEGVVVAPTPTPTPTPSATPRPTASIIPTATPRRSPSGGGGGGCTIAGPTVGIAMANVLMPLLPAVGIGLRGLLRRRNKRSENNNK